MIARHTQREKLSVVSQDRAYARLRAYISLARVDHWVKNVFVLPGIVIPLSFGATLLTWGLVGKLVLGILAVCLISSSNYVINEILDAPYDRLHPIKRSRPIPRGLVPVASAYMFWLALAVAGLTLASTVSVHLAWSLVALWVMGIMYNVPPLRSKDLPYVDVLSEAVNNPIRMLAGWYMVSQTLVVPISLLLSYWMVGCYFMALKRFSEYRELGDATAEAYRKSFRYYSERSLLVSVMFYSSTCMLFFGAFVIRYRIELVLAFPLIALVMAMYLNLAFEKNSAAQHPEALYRQPKLMGAVVTCAIAMSVLLVKDIPFLYEFFSATLPVRP
jgi:decaprenyl-phosphate phosphoribosyltransferase